MHTIADIRSWASEELRRARVDSPVLTADLLLGFLIGWDRVRILSHGEQQVSDETWDRLRRLVLRRANGEPLQYLTGEQEFFGLAFRVTPEVLIPRPETEILVEKALDLIRGNYPSSIRFADIGAGSGCIAVSIAHEVPSSSGFAVDVSASALQIARENAVRHGVAERILFVQSNLLDGFPQKPCLDFVLCNPPYIALNECDSLPPEVKNHEPHKALFGGESGLEIYRRLVPEVSPRLNAGGYLLLEVGAGQAQRVGELVVGAGLRLREALNDLQGIARCLVAQKTSREK
ncbi:MAG: peptide chain release factor N(5)-glutamine methyltransferase [Acidobacteria bacterium]|nr:peptide chain release factor N(5)-glutamine methyltransferase [Acidobacteriota bacterium]